MPEPMVVGMDTNSFGFHVASSVEQEIPTRDGTRRSKFCWYQAQSGDAQERRALIFPVAVRYFERLPAGSAVFIEEPIVMQTNRETTMKLVMVAGVLEAAFFAANPDASLFWVPLTVWRRAILGKGSGPKDEMKARAYGVAQSQWPIEDFDLNAKIFEDEPDLADATCVMLYGLGELATGKAVIN